MKVSVAVVLLCGLVLVLLPGANARGFRGSGVRLPKVSGQKVSIPDISVPEIYAPKDPIWYDTNSFPRIKDGEKIRCTFNKKVLLHERKRHTACRVASTGYAGLMGGTLGYPPTWTWRGGTPHHQLDGIPPTISWMGYPPPRCEQTHKLKI